MRTERVSADVLPHPAVLAVSDGRPVLVHASSTGSSVVLRTRSSTGRWRTGTLWPNSYDWTQFSVTAHRGHATVFVGAAKSSSVLVRSQDG
jgi:hypothetical protein